MKRTFKYCATHKEDEKYMQEMCEKGWAATRLVEGFWSFEACKPGEFCYRIAYLRGKSKEDVEVLKEEWKKRGISFVSRYSFWAILRSPEPFTLYTGEEEKEIVKKIYKPMPVGALVSWILSFASLALSFQISHFLWIPAALLAIYAGMCTWLMISYRKLLKKLG